MFYSRILSYWKLQCSKIFGYIFRDGEDEWTSVLTSHRIVFPIYYAGFQYSSIAMI